MKIPLADWGTKPIFTEENVTKEWLIKVPNYPLVELALDLGELIDKPTGLVPHFDPQVMAANYTTMAILRDHFPGYPIYGVVPTWTPRDHIRRMKAAGFRHLLLQWVAPWEFFHQQVHDLLDHCTIHVAGGDPLIVGWTWSKEKVL